MERKSSPPQAAAILGLDYGIRRVGCAVADDDGMIALPLLTITVTSRDQLLRELQARVRERRVGLLVVGLPLGLDGKDTEQTTATRAFARAAEQALRIPVKLFDERLTSAEAHQSGATKENVDAMAATLLLQSYLDRQHIMEEGVL